MASFTSASFCMTSMGIFYTQMSWLHQFLSVKKITSPNRCELAPFQLLANMLYRHTKPRFKIQRVSAVCANIRHKFDAIFGNTGIRDHDGPVYPAGTRPTRYHSASASNPMTQRKLLDDTHVRAGRSVD